MFKKALLAILFLPLAALAENQGSDLGLGNGASAILGRVNEAGTNIASADGKANYIALTKSGKVLTSTGTGATDFGKATNSAYTSGDVGPVCLGVRNDASAQLVATDGTYIPMSMTNRGHPQVELFSGTGSATQGEDVAGADGAVLFGMGAIAQDPLVVNQSTTGDWAVPKIDRAGRTIVTMAPAGETWQSCSASNTGTSDTAIKASVASNRIYVSSVSCFNTAAVASSIAFKDGSTQIYVGGIGNSTLNGVASWEHSLPVPLRLTSATAFNFAMGTNATATTCCAAGYVSVN